MNTVQQGIISIIVGFFGNMLVFGYVIIMKPEIFNQSLADVKIYSILGTISYGELSYCVYSIGALGLMFVIIGALLIIGKKYGWVI